MSKGLQCSRFCSYYCEGGCERSAKQVKAKIRHAAEGAYIDTGMHSCCVDKRPGDQLFDTFDANDLNKRLRELMDGLSAKVRLI